MITMEPKIQSTTSTRALRSKIGPIKAYLFKTSYVSVQSRQAILNIP